jgi:hypothetical protein
MSEQDIYLEARKKTRSNIDPTAPPEEAIEKIQQVAEKHGVADRIEDLIYDFLNFHDIDAENPPVVILRSGHRVTYEPDPEDLLENLLNAVIGESLKKASSSDFETWDEFLEKETSEGSDEIYHITNNANEAIIRGLFEMLLSKEVERKRDSLYKEAFPNLRANPDTVSETLEDTKSGMVLLLGKDTDEGLERLQRIGEYLEENHGLNCVLLKEQPEHEAQGFKSKLFLYATLSRYIIVEHTFPSGHLYELPYMENIECVMLFLREEGRGATRVADRSIEENPFAEEFTYELDDLEQTLDEAVSWCERNVENNIELNADAWDWYESE